MVGKRVLSFLVAIGLMVSVNISVLADPYDDINNQQNNLNQQQNNLNSEKNKLKSNRKLFEQAQSEIQQLELKIEGFDTKIEGLMRDVDNTNGLITKKEGQIDVAKVDLHNAEQNIVKEEDLFHKRMRSMYINGIDSYLEIILSSKGLDQLISNIELLKSIVQYDKQLILDLKVKKSEIEVKKQSLENEKEILVSLKDEKEDKLAQLKNSKSEQEQLITKAQERRDYYASTVAEYNQKIKTTQRMIDEAAKKIQQMKAALATKNPSRGSSSVTGQEIVAFASKYIGTPYVWAAAGPKYFDCSGLVQYTYKHFGINLTRTTFTQVKEGKYVKRSELQPGDLVFFGTKNYVHHVGIYVGNNCYLHAPRTGDHIKISPLTRSDYYTARRILQ